MTRRPLNVTACYVAFGILAVACAGAAGVVWLIITAAKRWGGWG